MIFSLRKFIKWCQDNGYSFYNTNKAHLWAKELEGLSKEEIKEKDYKIMLIDEWFEEF